MQVKSRLLKSYSCVKLLLSVPILAEHYCAHCLASRKQALQISHNNGPVLTCLSYVLGSSAHLVTTNLEEGISPEFSSYKTPAKPWILDILNKKLKIRLWAGASWVENSGSYSMNESIFAFHHATDWNQSKMKYKSKKFKIFVSASVTIQYMVVQRCVPKSKRVFLSSHWI